MSAIIKAADHNAAAHGVAFNFDDMAAKANQYLARVRGEAAQLIAQAEKEAQAIRNRAEVDGRRAGHREVETMVQQQLGQQMVTLLPALKEVVQEIHHAKQAWLAHWEKAAVHVAAGIAGRVVRRELPKMPQITLSLMREALELAAGSSQLRIQLNPADHETLKPQAEALIKEVSGLGDAELVSDPQVSPGGCRVETRFGVIDQQLETQLRRIEEELT